MTMTIISTNGMKIRKLGWSCWCSSKGGIMFRKFRKNKSIFSYLLLGMCMLILAETAILAESLRVGGIYEKLNQNAKDIVDQK